MQIAVLSKDERLWNDLTSFPYLLNVTWESYFTIEELFKDEVICKYQYLILSDRFGSIESYQNWFIKIRQNHSEVKVILLMSNSHRHSLHKQLLHLCETHQIDYILPGKGRTSIVEQIHRIIEGSEWKSKSKSSGKIVCFAGTTPNIGTTMIALGTATMLAQETTSQIGYLCVNLKSSKVHRYLGKDEHQTSLDDLRTELKARSLSRERLLSACEKIEGLPKLHVLFGNIHREQADYYTVEEIEYLLMIARSAFDVCVVDVNAYWDNAGTVCAMIEANARIIVTTPELSHFQEDLNKWVTKVGSALGILTQHTDLVVNQLEKKSSQYGVRLKDIEKETQMRMIGTVKRHDYVSRQLNEGKIMELYQSGSKLRTELTTIVHQLIDRFRLTRQIHLPKRISFFGKK
jgi:MinD-like ATPase involved in chromosome partitioning or flagellar assembly